MMFKILTETAAQRMLQITLILGFLLTSYLASAAELYAEANVLSAEPIIEVEQSHQQLNGCPGVKPVGNNILDLIDWDLRSGNCLVTNDIETISGYLVRYQWDEQVFSQVMSEPPGRTVPIYLNIQ